MCIRDSTITADSSKLEVISLGSVVTTTPNTIEATFIPDKSWTKTTKINLAVSDGNVNGATRVNDTTFVMNVRRMPRPEFKLSIGQNPSFTRYYEFMVTDTTEKAKSLKMYVYKNNTIPVGEVKMDSLGLFTWVGGFEFDTTANYRFEMQGQGVVGDTTINDTVSHALARAKGAWRAMSSDGGFSVSVSKATVPQAVSPTQTQNKNEQVENLETDYKNDPRAIKSPMVGTVYLQPEPGANKFVDIGSQIKSGQTLLIIEAMKTMNPIESSLQGKVLQILVENEQAVEFGQPLMLIG